MIQLAIEASAAVPVNPWRGGSVLGLVIVVALLVLLIPTSKGPKK